MESLVTYNVFLKLSYVTLQGFELHVSNCAHILLFRMKPFTNSYLGLISMGQHDHTTMLNS